MGVIQVQHWISWRFAVGCLCSQIAFIAFLSESWGDLSAQSRLISRAEWFIGYRDTFTYLNREDRLFSFCQPDSRLLNCES